MADRIMLTFTAAQARSKLYKLIDDAVSSHRPIIITGKHGNAVLLAEEDWKAIKETLYLTSLPGIRASIVKGINTPLPKCKKGIVW